MSVSTALLLRASLATLCVAALLGCVTRVQTPTVDDHYAVVATEPYRVRGGQVQSLVLRLSRKPMALDEGRSVRQVDFVLPGVRIDASGIWTLKLPLR